MGAHSKRALTFLEALAQTNTRQLYRKGKSGAKKLPIWKLVMLSPSLTTTWCLYVYSSLDEFVCFGVLTKFERNLDSTTELSTNAKTAFIFLKHLFYLDLLCLSQTHFDSNESRWAVYVTNIFQETKFLSFNVCSSFGNYVQM